jgi:hypothetical protein
MTGLFFFQKFLAKRFRLVQICRDTQKRVMADIRDVLETGEPGNPPPGFPICQF